VNPALLTETSEGVILNVRAQPRSSRAGLDGFLGDAVKVRIRSAPVDGKANRELVETVAEAFDLSKSRVSFKSGETSKTKRLLLAGVSRARVEGVLTLLTGAGFTLSLNNLLGVEGVCWKWNWAWCPGLIPFLLASIISFAVFRMPEEAVRKSFSVTAKQCGGAAVTLCFGVSMVYLYRNTAFQSVRDYSMLQILAIYISQLFCSAYLAVAPLIGVLGAFMSGSNTVSNTLFSGLQYETARLVKLSPVLILTLQNIGGAAGNMICINNVVAVCATTGISGKEGRLIKTNVLPCLIYCAFAAVFIAFIQIFS